MKCVFSNKYAKQTVVTHYKVYFNDPRVRKEEKLQKLVTFCIIYWHFLELLSFSAKFESH